MGHGVSSCASTSANSSYVSVGFFFKEDIRRAAASAHGARAVPVVVV